MLVIFQLTITRATLVEPSLVNSISGTSHEGTIYYYPTAPLVVLDEEAQFIYTYDIFNDTLNVKVISVDLQNGTLLSQSVAFQTNFNPSSDIPVSFINPLPGVFALSIIAVEGDYIGTFIFVGNATGGILFSSFVEFDFLTLAAIREKGSDLDGAIYTLPFISDSDSFYLITYSNGSYSYLEYITIPKSFFVALLLVPNYAYLFLLLFFFFFSFSSFLFLLFFFFFDIAKLYT